MDVLANSDGDTDAERRILNCASVSGVNLGDVLLAEMIPWIVRRKITLCDLSGVLAALLGGLHVGAPSLHGNRSRLSRFAPSFIRSGLKRYLAGGRLRTLAKMFDEVWIGGGSSGKEFSEGDCYRSLSAGWIESVAAVRWE